MGFQDGALAGSQRPTLPQNAVRDADLADVVEQEPILDALLVEQRRVDRACEIGRIHQHALRMRARADVLGLERRRQCADRLPVRVLEQRALPSLDLEKSAEILRVQLHLLFPVGGDASWQCRIETSEQAIGHCQELERAERLAQETLRERLASRLARTGIGARQDDDRDRRRARIALELTAERKPVGVGEPDVEDDEIGRACCKRRSGVCRVIGLLHIELDSLERGTQQRAEACVVVDYEDARAAHRRNGLRCHDDGALACAFGAVQSLVGSRQ